MELTSLPAEFIETPIGDKPYPVPETLTNKASLSDILAYARANGVSDVHITTNNPIALRKFSKLTSTGSEPMTPQRIEELLKNEIPAPKFEEFQNHGDLEFVLTVPGSPA